MLCCAPQEEAVALRKEGSGVVLDCQLPHLIGIDENLLSTGIILYYLKVSRSFRIIHTLLCLSNRRLMTF